MQLSQLMKRSLIVMAPLVATPVIAACAHTDAHTGAPESGEPIHNPPRPQADVARGELEPVDPQANVKRGKPPGYWEVVRVWSDPAGNPDMWRTTGVAVDGSLLSACDINVNETYFGYDSAKLTDSAKTTLQKVAMCHDDGRVPSIRVVGHADPRGDDPYNKELGKSRAEAVAEYLSKQGVPGDALDVESRGEKLASEDEEEWPEDRRVDLLIGS